MLRILAVAQQYAVLDFSDAVVIGDRGDDLDALAAGVIMLGEELRGWHEDFEQRVADRTAELAASFERLEAEATERRRAEELLARINTELSESVTHLRRANEQIGLLAEMSNLLHLADEPDQVFDAVGRLAPGIFAAAGGAIYTHAPAGVERVVAWGPEAAFPPSIDPERCWALRSGRPHGGSGPAAHRVSICHPE